VAVSLQVAEHKRIFAGNQAFDADTLAEPVTVKTFSFLGYIGFGNGGGYVTARQVELDGERLVGFYRGRAFADVKVRGEVATSRKTFGLVGANAANAGTMDRGSGSLYVRFTIEERPRVRVASETSAVAAEASAGSAAAAAVAPPRPKRRPSSSTACRCGRERSTSPAFSARTAAASSA